MSARRTGITLASVLVAVAAFVVSTIYAQNIQDQADLVLHAIDAWTSTSNNVDKEAIEIAAIDASELSGAKRRLETRLHAINELEGTVIGLSQTDIPKDSKQLDALIKMTEQSTSLQDRMRSVGSLAQVTTLDAEAAKLFNRLRALGVLFNSYATTLQEELQIRKQHVRYVGYPLGILAIIIAGIAQLA